VRLAGLRVCGVGGKGCPSQVARARFAFVLPGLLARGLSQFGVSRAGVWLSGAGHNHRRIAGHPKQRYRFFERHHNGAAVLTIRSSGRRSIACVLPIGAAGAAYLKR